MEHFKGTASDSVKRDHQREREVRKKKKWMLDEFSCINTKIHLSWNSTEYRILKKDIRNKYKQVKDVWVSEKKAKIEKLCRRNA